MTVSGCQLVALAAKHQSVPVSAGRGFRKKELVENNNNNNNKQ